MKKFNFNYCVYEVLIYCYELGNLNFDLNCLLCVGIFYIVQLLLLYMLLCVVNKYVDVNIGEGKL